MSVFFQLIIIILSAELLFFNNTCQTQKMEDTDLVLESIEWKPVKLAAVIDAEKGEGYHIENALPEGYVQDGTKDYTAYIQLAISRYKEIIFPPFPLLINDKGLRIPANRKITFLKGSELRLEPSRKDSYSILYIKDASNVMLIDPVIKGDWKTHLGTKGEWGMGIRITSSTNITIYNPKVFDCWGDGIYISGGIKDGVSSNIHIVNAYCRNNRRNGISVISVNGLLLESPYAGYNNGTDPQSGIDIEPNNPNDEIKNIKIINARTEYNPGKGIVINLNKLYGQHDKTITIDLINPIDYASGEGFLISSLSVRSKKGEKLKGHLNIVEPVWKMNEKGAIRARLKESGISLSISNPKIINSDGQTLKKEVIKQLIEKHIGENVHYQLE